MSRGTDIIVSHLRKTIRPRDHKREHTSQSRVSSTGRTPAIQFTKSGFLKSAASLIYEHSERQPGASSAGNLMMACHFQGAVYEDYTDLYPMDPGFTAGFTAYMDSARTPTAGYRCLIMPGSSHDHLPWRTCRLTTGEWWFYLGFGVACGLSQNLYSWRSQIDISMRQFFYTKETKVSFCGGTCVLRNDNQEGLNDWHSSCCLQWKFLSENKCIRKMAARSNPKQRPRVTENNRECHCYTIFS